ncbi:coiled-coil domain-containing protein [Ureibacillus acetophenoni]|uniref:Uncharacterized protein n=1 Tax=Ureibacillus acetophenoni TaxID=614649 RepID=A0A285U5W6_9BACL|nr:hypothetical protein [Ureibacillus acetophenoni]SOC37077.1 hypothetical protein SAMN05877842_1038 [Ureibacillus acetophenoni]
MIILGKTKTLFFPNTDKTERLAIDVVATLTDNVLIPLHEEFLQQVLPNNGKVFVPSYFTVPEEHQYKLWELEESHEYSPSVPTSRKYFLKREVLDVSLYEVITLQANFETEKRAIETKLRNPISYKEKPLPHVVFTSKDGYVIGPVKLKHIFDEAYTLVEDNYVEVYKMDVEQITIQNRKFAITDITEGNFVGFIDVADDERAVRDSLKILKEQYDFGDLSRKVIARLSEIYTDKSGEIGERLIRAQQIIQSKTFSEEAENFFRSQLLDLPYVQQVIAEQTDEALEKLLIEFKEKYSKLLNEIEKVEQELEEKNQELIQTEEVLEQKHTLLHSVEESFSAKLTQLEKEFADAYVEYFLRQGINIQKPITQNQYSQQITEISPACVKVVAKNQHLATLKETHEIFHTNRKLLHIRDRYETLHKTVLGAILFRNPLIIAGPQSFELAQFIGHTYSANKFFSVVPEVNKFSFATLEHIAPCTEDKLSSVHLHNLHYTQGEFALKSYVELMKWSDRATQLLILTFDNVQDAINCIHPLGCTPLLYAEDYLNYMILPSKFKKLHFSQIDLTEVEELELTDCSTFNTEFEAWFEGKFGYQFEQSFALDNWLSIIASDLDGSNNKELEHVYKLFEHYISRLKRDEES